MAAVAVIFLTFEVIGGFIDTLGFGIDIWYVDPGNLTLALKLFYIDEIFYLVLLALTKVSILFFYLRIFPHQYFRILCWIVMCWVIVSTTIFLFLLMFQCTPLSSIWESWKGDYPVSYHCLEVTALVYTAAGFSISQDMVILIMPLPLLLKLNIEWRRKAGIIIMFSLGIFVLATSCIRLRYMVRFARSTNITWNNTDVLIWSGMEVAVSVLVASLPAIRSLMVVIWPKMLTSMRKSSGRGGGSPSDLQKPAPGLAIGANKRLVRSPQSHLFSMLANTRGRDEESQHPFQNLVELNQLNEGHTPTEINAKDSPVSASGTASTRLTLGSTIGVSFLTNEEEGSTPDDIMPIGDETAIQTTPERDLV